MKRTILVLVVVTSISFLTGCAAFVVTPIMGGLYTGVTAPVTYDPGAQGQPYKILGEVEGKATATSILGLIAAGDASVNSAYKNALKQIPNADDLIEVKVDYKGTSFLGLFASYTTIVRAKAIKRNSSTSEK